MHRPMKQLPERAVSESEAREILRIGEYCVVATVDEDGHPYATPLSYALDGDTLLIHTSAAGGQKTEDWERDPRVCVTVALDMEPGYFTPDGEEGFFTTRFASVIATGTVRRVTDSAQVRRALAELCLKYSPEFKHEIGGAIDRELPVTAVWAIDLNHISGKAGRRVPNGKGMGRSQPHATGYSLRDRYRMRKADIMAANHDLVLYYRPTCPFCARVTDFMKRRGIDMPLRNISTDPEAAAKLAAVGGKQQVPCLFIDGAPLYESGDIIAWLDANL